MSIWVLTTIHTGYSLQFKHSPSTFQGVTPMLVTDPQDAVVVSQEVAAAAKIGYLHDTPSPLEGRVLLQVLPGAQGGWWPQTNLRPQTGPSVTEFLQEVQGRYVLVCTDTLQWWLT